MNVDQITLKLEDLNLQLEYHANYFENRFGEIDGNTREISNQKLALEYFTYHKILSNLNEEVKQLRLIVNQSNKG